jgi:hypothetical protein
MRDPMTHKRKTISLGFLLLVACSSPQNLNNNKAATQTQAANSNFSDPFKEYKRKYAKENLAKAKALSKKPTKENLVSAEVLLQGIPENAPESKEAKRLYDVVHAKALKIFRREVDKEMRQKTYFAPDFESAGIHKTATGRIYSVEVTDYGPGAKRYSYTGYISGYVVMGKNGIVIEDTREYH